MTDGIPCHECGYLLDAATGIGDQAGKEPTKGAISICLYCGVGTVFTGEGYETRPATEEERKEIDEDEDIQKLRQALAIYRKIAND